MVKLVKPAAAAPITPIIEVSKLSKHFSDKVVLNDVSLTVKRGKSVVILGASGGGKSVLIKCICGLLQPDPGSSVLIDGVEVSDKSIVARGDREYMAFLFQSNALFDSMTVERNILFAVESRSGSDQTAKEEWRRIQRDNGYSRHFVEDKLADVGLEPRVAQLFPKEISGGMQKRVALARSLAARPSVLFCDEPTSGLDPLTAKRIADLMERIREKHRITLVSISHDPIYTGVVADEIVFLLEGKVAWHGDIKKDKSFEKFEFLRYFGGNDG